MSDQQTPSDHDVFMARHGTMIQLTTIPFIKADLDSGLTIEQSLDKHGMTEYITNSINVKACYIMWMRLLDKQLRDKENEQN